ncbi:MAG: FecR family protein [Spirochaetota bacterium]
MEHIRKLFAGMLLLLLTSPGIVSQTKNAKIMFFVGKVEISQNGNSREASKGMQIRTGDTVTTGTQSSVIIRDTSSNNIKMRENSSLVYSRENDRTELTLAAGSVFSKVQKLGKDPHYFVKTPTMVAAVRGTEFFVAYGSRNNDLWVCVNKGIVSVSTTAAKKSVDLKEGEGVMISEGTRVSDPRRYEWTRKLNWNMDPDRGQVIDDTDVNEAYKETESHDW